MNIISSTLLFAVFCILSTLGYAQSINQETFTYEAYFLPENDAQHPCISVQEYEIIEKRCNENIRLLNLEVPIKQFAPATIAMIWPVKAASGLHDCSFYHVSAYVDQNTATGAVQDFNCGSITYDGHRGTDISSWPYNFYKMDNNLVEVVAAAPGIILDKHDGEFDRNCTSNNLTANYIIIRHDDGSQALYWHMKKNAVTTKAIGQAVVAGEYLGIVGSSGSSSGPHLHFEVWSGSTVATRVDPFYGSCNKLNTSTWWASQKAYRETSIVKASVHTTDVVAPPCPATETLNESTTFQVPFQGPGLSPGYAKFYIFIRDEVNGLVADLSILNQDATPFLTWTYTSSSATKVKMWGFSKKLPTTAGKYTFKAVYNGITCASQFDITTQTGVPMVENNKGITIYPNPTAGDIHILNEGNENAEITIYNMLGEMVGQAILKENQTTISLDRQNGVFLYIVKTSQGVVASGKLVVE